MAEAGSNGTPEQCRVERQPISSLAACRMDMPQCGRQNPSQRRVCAWWTESEQCSPNQIKGRREKTSLSCDCTFGLNVLIRMLIKDTAKTTYIWNHTTIFGQYQSSIFMFPPSLKINDQSIFPPKLTSTCSVMDQVWHVGNSDNRYKLGLQETKCLEFSGTGFVQTYS